MGAILEREVSFILHQLLVANEVEVGLQEVLLVTQGFAAIPFTDWRAFYYVLNGLEWDLLFLRLTLDFQRGGILTVKLAHECQG